MSKNRKINFLEESEVEAIIAKIRRQGARNLRDRALISVLFSTGLRISEALALQAKDFEPEAGIPETKELAIVGKGGRQRVVFFSPSSLVAVFEYQCVRGKQETDPRLFPLTPRGAQKIVKRRSAIAGLGDRNVTPHVFRHSNATNSLRKGANVRQVQDYLGHANIATTMIYTHCTSEELRDLHKKIYG
jgi:integrase/recombinase XerD